MHEQFASRTLFAVPGLGRGGSEIQLVQLLGRLAPELPDCTLLVLNPGRDDLLGRVQSAGIRTIVASRATGWGPPGLIIKLAQVVGTLLRVRPRLIYAWQEEAALLLVPWALLTRTPVIVARRNLAGSRAERRHPALARVQRWLERHATLVTANSEAVALAAEARGVDRGRIRIIRNGHEPADQLPLPEGEELVIGYLANFRPVKGHAMMLDALCLLSADLAWRALFGGRGPDVDTFSAEVERRGLTHRIAVAPVDDSRSFWRRCHVAALLSDHEGSPNALIEAALAGRPIVATNVGGTTEIVADGAGVLVAPGDAAAAARALDSLIRCDRERLRAMGTIAHRHATSRFDMATMVAGHRNALREAGVCRTGIAR